MLNNKLKYVPVDITDIGYPVSDKSKNIIRDLVAEIGRTISSDMARLNNVLIDNFKNLELEMLDDDMYSLLETLKKESNALARISSINESAKAEDLVSRTRGNLPKSCESAAKPLLDDMENLGKFYTFLQDISDQKFEPMAWEWVKEIHSAINYVENSVKWYDFLAVLYQRLSQYDVQKDIKLFNVPEFESTSVPLASNQNFINFFNEISNLNFLKVINFQELLKVNVDVTKVQYFDRVVLSTLRAFPNFVTENSGQRVLYQAESIRMKNSTIQAKYSAETIQLKLHHSPNLVRDESSSRFLVTGEFVKMSELIAQNGYKNVTSVQILAQHAVFVDADIVKNIDISIIAPRWVIIGSRTIDLSGSPGPEHVTFKAQNGYQTEGARNGHDGRPGNPGGSAGHFFGIGNSFENIENLKLRAVGGRGGFGQDGGDGARGANAVSHWISDCKSVYCNRDEECYTNVEVINHYLWVEFKTEYTKYASNGGRGGDAGRGGAPGIGGYSGNITLFSIGDSKASAFMVLGRGEYGEFGLHGKCGPGGSGSAGYKATWSHNAFTGNEGCNPRWENSSFNGDTGTCLYVSSLSTSDYKNRQQPVPKEFLFPPSFAIADFRKQLITNLKDPVRKRQALEFYEMLQKQEIIQHDKPELIFQELALLEMSHNQLAPGVARLLYNSLLKRVQENYKSLEKVPASKEHKLLEFLSLAINSQLLRLESKSKSRQIFKLRTYFDLLKTTDVANIRQFFVARAKDEIKSAEHLISIINDDIFYIIRDTTNEVIRLSQKDNNELGDQLLRMKLFVNLKVIGDFLMLCLSLAEADMALVNTLRVTSALPFVQTTMSAVDGSRITENLSIIEEIFGEYIDTVRNSISKVVVVLGSSGVEYEEICDQLQDVDSILQSRKSLARKSSVSAYFSTSDVVQRVRNINEVLLKETNPMVRDVANELKQDFKLIEFNARLYDTLLTQKIDSSGIVSCIENSLSTTSVNDAFINKIVVEIFEAVSSVLLATRNSLTGSLYKPDDLKNLRVKVSQALSLVKLNISKLLHQIEIDEDLQSTIENINEAADAVKSIFNGPLLSNHDRFLFSSFHTQLKEKSELGNPFQKYLVGVIDANTLFYEYECLLDVYRKYYSPFDLSIPDTTPVPNIDETLSIYRSSIATSVQILESKLNSLDENRTHYTISDDFNSSNKNGAFFTWTSENYEESISKLLRGKRIALKATIVNKNFGFLKFNDIRLSFKSDDQSIQSSLDEALSNFNAVMTHSGRSYFNLCDRVQLMNQDSLQFIYKVNETVTEIDDPNADPMRPLLSPYTTWIFEMKPVNENVTFSSLLPYRKTEISIALEGNATHVDLQNKTVCQNILRNDPEIDAAFDDSTDQPKLIRKRRDVDSSEGIFGARFKNFFNPFFNLISNYSDPRFDHSTSPPQLEGSNYTPNQSTNFLPSLNMNAALTLANFVVRNFTTVKPYPSVEASISPEDARVIALNILDWFENILKNLAQDELDDPIKLICQLEKFILRQEYDKIFEVLSQSATLDPSLGEKVRREFVQVMEQSLDGSALRSADQIEARYSRYSDGLLCNKTDGTDDMLNGNFDYSLLN